MFCTIQFISYERYNKSLTSQVYNRERHLKLKIITFAFQQMHLIISSLNKNHIKDLMKQPLTFREYSGLSEGEGSDQKTLIGSREGGLMRLNGPERWLEWPLCLWYDDYWPIAL